MAKYIPRLFRTWWQHHGGDIMKANDLAEPGKNQQASGPPPPTPSPRSRRLVPKGIGLIGRIGLTMRQLHQG
jgi:hypothetical protein